MGDPARRNGTAPRTTERPENPRYREDGPPAPDAPIGAWAEWYAGHLGWRILPLHYVRPDGSCSCGNRGDCATDPGRRGKHPDLDDWRNRASADVAQVRKWWSDGRPRNIGCVPGEGEFRLDVDPDHGGDESLDEYEARSGPLPEAPEVLTRSGGRHLFLVADRPVRQTIGELGPGLDTRTDRGYTVLPPSRGFGGAYTWREGYEAWSMPMAEAPQEMLQLLEERPDARPRLDPIADRITAGTRNDTLFRNACAMRARGFGLADLRAFLEIANKRCDPPLSARDLDTLAAQAARYEAGRPLEVSPREIVQTHDADVEELAVVTADQIEAESVRWLWYPRIPSGSLSLLSGDGGSGKTFLSLDLAARVTTGRAFPGSNETRDPGSVLYLSAEDHVAMTLKPRLKNVFADGARVHLIVNRGRERSTGKEYVTLPSLDLSQAGRSWFEEQISRFAPALVVIDPLTAFLPGINMHSDNEVRSALAPLARIADVHGVAIVAIRHMPKRRAEKAAYAGLGSVAFSNLARSELFAIADENDDPHDKTTRSTLYHPKMNLAPKGEALGYQITPIDRENARFDWTGVSSRDYRDVLSGETHGGSIESADEFLREVLADGPRKASDVLRLAEEAGITERTLRRAAAALRPNLLKRPSRSGDKITHWEWVLTNQNAPARGVNEVPDDAF